MKPAKTRIRRTKEASRQLILEAAEALLRERGPDGVNVRAVGAAVGLTDAAVNHHFGTREELFEALLRHCGRRLKLALGEALDQWGTSGTSLEQLVDVMTDVYADGRYGELALQLHMAGWRDRGAGMLDPVVHALHAQASSRRAPTLNQLRFAVGLLHQTIALDPLFGAEFRRSAGMARPDEPAAREKRRLWVTMLKALLIADGDR